MVIGDKLKELRETKKLSQGDIEKRTGLLRCYISRVENGHTVPNVDTLEKMARAFPMYRLFTDEDRIEKPNISFSKTEKVHSKKEDAALLPFAKALARMNDKEQRLLLHMASKNGEPSVRLTALDCSVLEPRASRVCEP